MNQDVLEVNVRAVLPGGGGSAVFLGNEGKAIVIYIDNSIGAAITMFMQETPKERPLTHDLVASLLTALGAKVERVVINDIREKTFFARLIISSENEIHQRKIVELDARPSDSIALAIQQKAPIYIARHVWEQTDDMSEILERMEEGDFDPEIGDDED